MTTAAATTVRRPSAVMPSWLPLTLVPCLVAIGTILDGRLPAAPTVVLWFVLGVAVSYAVLFSTFFILRGGSPGGSAGVATPPAAPPVAGRPG